jgi:hypothetical protein
MEEDTQMMIGQFFLLVSVTNKLIVHYSYILHTSACQYLVMGKDISEYWLAAILISLVLVI